MKYMLLHYIDQAIELTPDQQAEVRPFGPW